jgi:alpha-beta hydrolase superfamily lysophospholipase
MQSVVCIPGVSDSVAVIASGSCRSRSSKAAAISRSAGRTLKLYEGHYHDLLNDLGKEEVFGDTKAWIDARA